MMTPRWIAPAFALIAIALLSGCGGGLKLQSEDALRADLTERGLNPLLLSDFSRVDLLIQKDEDSAASLYLENMPTAARGTAPWIERKAVLLARAEKYPEALKLMEEAREDPGWTREGALLTAWLKLTDAQPGTAADIAAQLVTRSARDPKAWRILTHAVGMAPDSEQMQAMVNALNQRYPNLPESKLLSAQILWGRGRHDTAKGWVENAIKARPNDVWPRLMLLTFLRESCDWRRAGQVIRELIPMCAESDPMRRDLELELESILEAARQDKEDPLTSAVRPPGGVTAEDAPEQLQALLPRGVPANERDPRDGRALDLLDNNGEPLYFLPVRAGSVVFAGPRIDEGFLTLTPKEGEHRIKHAWDFVMPEGSPVLAARGGIVRRVTAPIPFGDIEYDRVIEVAHRDGTVARYWHVKRNQIRLEPGDEVFRGQLLAASGQTGSSAHTHLRFEVVEETESDRAWWEPYVDWTTIPIHFADVSEPDGVPKSGRWYRGRNVWVPPIY